MTTDLEQVRRKYRRVAGIYDLVSARPTEALRRAAVERLALRPGDRVLDLGCGTGLSLGPLRDAVGETGCVYGVDASPDMLARARNRVVVTGWKNAQLILADAETFEVPEPVDGLLCFFTHDILLSEIALPRAMKFLAPGARLAAAGVMLANGWRGWLINPVTVAYSFPAVTKRDVARSFRPFAVLDPLVSDLRVEEQLLGSHYLAWGMRVGETSRDGVRFRHPLVRPDEVQKIPILRTTAPRPPGPGLRSCT